MKFFYKDASKKLLSTQIHQVKSSTSQKHLLASRPSITSNQIKVGHYKYWLNNVLGKGYSSTVYEGVRIGRESQKYAIKVVDLKKFRNAEMLQNEVEIHKTLNHENIVKCFDAIKTSNHYYLILEYCPHGSLKDFISQKYKLTESIAINIMGQILEGYKYLLQQEIVHRDLKPANILRIGNKWKIADFGFAVRTKFKFKDRINVGTPCYMPIESLGKNIYSFRSDFFSLGVILYEMLTGQRPWESETEEGLIKAIREKKIEMSHFQHCRAKLFIQRCCQPQDCKRFGVQEIKKFQFKCSQDLLSQDNQPQHISSDVFSSRKLKKNLLQLAESAATKESHSKISQNSQKLKAEVQFCKMLKKKVSKIQQFGLQGQKKQLVTLQICKYILKSIRLLKNQNISLFQLNCCQSFKSAKNFESIKLEIVFDAIKLQKECSDYVKSFEGDKVQFFQIKQSQSQFNSHLNQKICKELVQFVAHLIKQQNRELQKLYKKGTGNQRDKIQALDNLFTFYNQINSKKIQHQDSQVGEILESPKNKKTLNCQYHQMKSFNYSSLKKLIQNF